METVEDYWRLHQLLNRYQQLNGDCNTAFLPDIVEKKVDYAKWKKGAAAVGLAALGAYGLSKIGTKAKITEPVLKKTKIELEVERLKVLQQITQCEMEKKCPLDLPGRVAKLEEELLKINAALDNVMK